MRFPIFGCLALALPLLVASAAIADITRGCAGELWMTYGNNAQHKVTLATVDATGSCKNRVHANDCRQRALGAMRSCMTALWDDRDKSDLPVACNTSTGGSRSAAKLTWDGIIPNPNPTLKTRIEYYTCCTPRKRTKTFEVFITWTTRGDRGCGPATTGNTAYGAQEVMYPNYRANCQALRNQGLCGEPVRGNPAPGN